MRKYFRFYSMLHCKYGVCSFWFVFCRFKKVLSKKYSSLLQDPVTPSHFLLHDNNLHDDNLHDEFKKNSEEQKLIKTGLFRVIIIVIFERGVGVFAEGLYSETSTQRISIITSSTNRRKKTHRLTSDWETKVFPNRMGKKLYRQNSFKLCQRMRNSLEFKTFSEQNSRVKPRIFNRVSLIENRNRQIASERSNRTSGQSRTWVICKLSFYSSKVKRPKTSCDQFEATKQTCLQSKISYGKPGKYSFTSKTGRIHDKDRFIGRLYVGASGIKIKMSPSFIFDGKIYHFK